MSISYSPALRAVIDELSIPEEEILFLTITQYWMHEIRQGGKDIEYRTLSEYYLNMLFRKDKQGKYSEMKPKHYLLLQGGRSANSPRMLLRLKGWVIDGKSYPEGLDLTGHMEVDPECINLILGEKLYDSVAFSIAVPKKTRERKPPVRMEITPPEQLRPIKQPINTVEVTYQQTGKSKQTNAMGMREMQALAYEQCRAKYLLIKAPPASGKSRALMFIALDKLIHQRITKAIVAVPERAIAASFDSTELSKYGFEADWRVEPKYNLCTPGGDAGKIDTFREFLESGERILLCTHATLRYAFDRLDPSVFDNMLMAIDEFHHVSAESDSKLGEVVRTLMKESKAHIVAMTGSYFRGDAIPVLMPEDEARFTKVTYTYYDQLNGYEYLKSLGIGYHFYQGRYYAKQEDSGVSALEEILDETKKTIVHIPSVNAAESSRQKYEEVSHVIDCLGEIEYQDEETKIYYVRSKRSGRLLKVADLVEDTPAIRNKVVAYLRQMSKREDLDILIALGMAKEGFDWPYCEQALTIGYRGSLTEIVQIIGRTTRDAVGKSHAQFTNLIAQPDAADDEVKVAVNNMLKAITASLLMEQVLAPDYDFKPKDLSEDSSEDGPNTLRIEGFKVPTSERAREIIDTDLNDLKARILQDETMLDAMPSTTLDPEVINKVLIPKVIREVYPDLSDEEVEAVRQHVVVDMVVKNGEQVEQAGKKFLRMAGSFVNIDDITIDLIDRVNPFQKAFAILSTALDKRVLKTVQDVIDLSRIEMTKEEAIILWPKINEWVRMTGKEPNLHSSDPSEKRLAEALLFLRKAKADRERPTP